VGKKKLGAEKAKTEKEPCEKKTVPGRKKILSDENGKNSFLGDSATLTQVQVLVGP